MFFSIKELAHKKIRFNQDFVPGSLVFPDTSLKQVSTLHAEGVAELLDQTEGDVRITGRVSTEITAECDRCLGELQIPVDAAIDLFYRPAQALTADGEDEVEIGAAETDIAFYEGTGIELEQVITEQILLLAPMHPVCRADCKGICPTCGENKNTTECNCQTTDPANDRWQALKSLSGSTN